MIHVGLIWGKGEKKKTLPDRFPSQGKKQHKMMLMKGKNTSVFLHVGLLAEQKNAPERASRIYFHVSWLICALFLLSLLPQASP